MKKIDGRDIIYIIWKLWRMFYWLEIAGHTLQINGIVILLSFYAVKYSLMVKDVKLCSVINALQNFTVHTKLKCKL